MCKFAAKEKAKYEKAIAKWNEENPDEAGAKKGGKKKGAKGKKGKGKKDGPKRALSAFMFFSKAKRAEIKAANDKAIAETDALKAHVRKAADDNMMGRTSPDVKKQQWSGPTLVQTKEDPKPAVKEEEEFKVTAKKGTHEFTLQHKTKAQQEAKDTVAQQEAEEAASLKAHAADSAKAESETQALKSAVSKSAALRTIGGVNLPKSK